MHAEFPYVFNLKNKVVLVTGAAGQLGRHLVTAFLQQRARVIALDTTLAALEEVATTESWSRSDTQLIACNIQCLSEVQAAFSSSIDVFSGIDILINNAGVSVFEPFMERTEESFDWVMDVNLKGTFFCIREFIKQTKPDAVDANIINIASMYGIISPDPRIYTDCDRKNSEVYGATKAAIIQMTRYFAVHAAPERIRVNSVSPGGIRNPQQPQGADFQKNYGERCPALRMAETHELVLPTLFLCSPAASYINGHNLVVDGAMSAW